jgi:hypothetical protein
MIDLLGNVALVLVGGAIVYVLGYGAIIGWIMWLHS